MTRVEELINAAERSLTEANEIDASYENSNAWALQSIAESLLAIAVMLKETRKEFGK